MHGVLMPAFLIEKIIQLVGHLAGLATLTGNNRLESVVPNPRFARLHCTI